MAFDSSTEMGFHQNETLQVFQAAVGLQKNELVMVLVHINDSEKYWIEGKIQGILRGRRYIDAGWVYEMTPNASQMQIKNEFGDVQGHIQSLPLHIGTTPMRYWFTVKDDMQHANLLITTARIGNRDMQTTEQVKSHMLARYRILSMRRKPEKPEYGELSGEAPPDEDDGMSILPLATVDEPVRAQERQISEPEVAALTQEREYISPPSRRPRAEQVKRELVTDRELKRDEQVDRDLSASGDESEQDEDTTTFRSRSLIFGQRTPYMLNLREM